MIFQSLVTQSLTLANETGDATTGGMKLLFAIALLVVPFMVGKFLAKAVRMPDYGLRIGIILCALSVSGAIVAFGTLKQGVDLKGGVILIYQVQDVIDESAEADTEGEQRRSLSGEEMRNLIKSITRRINPAGTKEIVVRPYGSDQIEVRGVYTAFGRSD